MNVQEQIDTYISAQPEKKREELEILHRMMLNTSPACKLWFFDGRNSEGRIVANPNIGYGSQRKQYANGDVVDSFQIGVSANKTGISIYLMGLSDKNYLPKTYGARLGKATVTGYCVKFRNLKDVDINMIEEMVATHMRGGSAGGL